MTPNQPTHRPGRGAVVHFLAGERRVTDRVVSLWKSARDKQTVLDSINDSELWAHCFLLIVDDDLDCSIILDKGESAARGLALDRRGATPLYRLPHRLAKRIHRLGLQCQRDQAPCLDACENLEAPEIPAKRCRMAVLPLIKQGKSRAPRIQRAANMLGVFTYC